MCFYEIDPGKNKKNRIEIESWFFFGAAMEIPIFGGPIPFFGACGVIFFPFSAPAAPFIRFFSRSFVSRGGFLSEEGITMDLRDITITFLEVRDPPPPYSRSTYFRRTETHFPSIQCHFATFQSHTTKNVTVVGGPQGAHLRWSLWLESLLGTKLHRHHRKDIGNRPLFFFEIILFLREIFWKIKEKQDCRFSR